MQINNSPVLLTCNIHHFNIYVYCKIGYNIGVIILNKNAYNK